MLITKESILAIIFSAVFLASCATQPGISDPDEGIVTKEDLKAELSDILADDDLLDSTKDQKPEKKNPQLMR